MNNDFEDKNDYSRKQHQHGKLSEEIYQTLFSLIDEGFSIIEVIFDEANEPLNYRFLETNTAFENLTELRNAVGKTILEFIPDLEKKWLEIYGKVALTGKSVRFTEKAVLTGRWFNIYATRIGGEKSRKVALLFRDITGQKRREANLAFLADVQDDFANLVSSDEIMKTVGAKIVSYFNASNCLFAAIDEPNNRVKVEYDWHQDKSQNFIGIYQLSEFVSDEFRRMAREGKPIVINNTQTDPRTDAENYAAYNIHSFVTVPFQRGGEWKYLFTVNNSIPREWKTDEIELIQEVTNRIFPRLERARAEEALSETNAVLNAINQNTPTLIYLKDRESRILSANPATIEVIGKPLEKIIGKSHAEYMNDYLEGEIIRANDRRIIESGKTETFEELVETDDNTHIFLSTKTPYFNENGETIGLIGVSVDITERKKAEEDLQASEERYRALVEASAQVVWTMEAEGQSDSHRHWFSQLTGRPIEEIKGKGYLSFVHPADREAMQNAWLEVMQNPAPYEVEFRLLTGENVYRYYNLRGVPLFNRDGTLREWIGTVKDINEQKEAEVYLQRYRLLSEKAGDVVWLISPGGNILEVNQAAIDTYGYTREELLQMNISNLREPSTLPILQEQLDQAAEYGIKFETLHVRKDGTVFPIEVNANGANFGGERLIMGIVRDITERKRLEAEVNRQFDELETIYRTAPIGLALVDKELRFVRINMRLAEINGIEAEKHIGCTIREIVPNIADQAEAVFRQVFETGEAVLNIELEGETEAQPGVRRNWNESWYPLRNEQGETFAVNVIVEEITERKKAETALQEKDELLSRVTNVTPTMLARCSYDCRYLFINQPVADFLGYQVEDIIGKPIKQIMGEAAFEAILPYVERVLRGERVEYESEIPYSTIGRRFMHVVYVPEYGDQNNVIGWFATITDITERKEAEKANSFLASIIEFSDDAIISKDLNGIITSWNKSAERIFGYKAKEIVGKSISLLIPTYLGDQEKQILEKLRKGVSIQHFETKRQCKDGTQIDVSLTISPIRDKEGNIIGASKIVRDITQRKQAEENLRESEERFRMASDATGALVYDADLTGQRQVFVYGLKRVVGYDNDESDLSREWWHSLIHPEDLPRHSEIYENISNWAEFIKVFTALKIKAVNGFGLRIRRR